jgi:hypothetical protein
MEAGMARDAYETVATVIGAEMNKAWNGILAKLADVATGRAAPVSVAALGGGTLSVPALQEFFANLGAADLGVGLVSRSVRGEGARYYAVDLDLTPAAGIVTTAAIEGSISVGVSIRF